MLRHLSPRSDDPALDRHRASLAAGCIAALALGGCDLSHQQLADYPLGVPADPTHISLKDTEPAKPAPKPIVKPQTPAAKVEPQSYLGIAPGIEVVNTDKKTASRLALALFHELNLRGHIKPQGNWQVIGAVDGDSVRWQLLDSQKHVVAEIDQKGLTDAAVAAIVAGVTSYLRLSL